VSHANKTSNLIRHTTEFQTAASNSRKSGRALAGSHKRNNEVHSCMTLYLNKPIKSQTAESLSNRKSVIVIRITHIPEVDNRMSVISK
jgi:hypothetical protein